MLRVLNSMTSLAPARRARSPGVCGAEDARCERADDITGRDCALVTNTCPRVTVRALQSITLLEDCHHPVDEVDAQHYSKLADDGVGDPVAD